MARNTLVYSSITFLGGFDIVVVTKRKARSFASLVGEPALACLTKWRMNLAAACLTVAGKGNRQNTSV